MSTLSYLLHTLTAVGSLVHMQISHTRGIPLMNQCSKQSNFIMLVGGFPYAELCAMRVAAFVVLF